VAETISDVRGISFDEIAEITKANAEKLFRI
jgi:Tat protein secretion system quality control protein TatD with DNase activity